MTRQRTIIYDVIRNSMAHMTAEQICAEAKKVYPPIALATVYRNLGLMAEAGEIRRISIPGEPDRFDRNTFPHGHAKCVRCGKVVDINIPDLKDEIRARTGFDIISCELSAVFICPDCKTDLK